MKPIKWIAFVLVLVLAASVLVSCQEGPTEKQVVADQCLSGNLAACAYYTTLTDLEKAQATKDAAEKVYKASLQVTATPPVTLTPSTTPQP